MSCWIETLDKKNLDYTINFIEFTGSANPLISKELQSGDYLFIYSREEGRILYRVYIMESDIEINEEENGSDQEEDINQGLDAICDPMVICDGLTKAKLEEFGFREDVLKDGIPSEISNENLIDHLNSIFDEYEECDTEETYNEKTRIIYSAKNRAI